MEARMADGEERMLSDSMADRHPQNTQARDDD